MLKWTWVAVLVIALDQLTKQLAEHYLQFNMPVEVMPLFNLTLLYNEGAAFSLFAGEAYARPAFIVLATVISLFLLRWMHQLKPDQRWLAIALALVLGGALGNVWDRIMLGHVIDFLDFYIGDSHWPAFNIADSAICIGVGMMMLDMYLEHRREKQAATESGKKAKA